MCQAKRNHSTYMVNCFNANCCSREKHLQDRLAKWMHVVLFRVSFAVKRSDRGTEPPYLERVYCTFTACWKKKKKKKKIVLVGNVYMHCVSMLWSKGYLQNDYSRVHQKKCSSYMKTRDMCGNMFAKVYLASLWVRGNWILELWNCLMLSLLHKAAGMTAVLMIWMQGNLTRCRDPISCVIQ